MMDNAENARNLSNGLEKDFGVFDETERRITQAIEAADEQRRSVEEKLLLTLKELEDDKENEQGLSSLTFSSLTEQSEKSKNIPSDLNETKSSTTKIIKKAAAQWLSRTGKGKNTDAVQLPTIVQPISQSSESDWPNETASERTQSNKSLADARSAEEGRRSFAAEDDKDRASDDSKQSLAPDRIAQQKAVRWSFDKKTSLRPALLSQLFDQISEEIASLDTSQRSSAELPGDGKPHVSIGIQVNSKERSDFEKYVDLKRKLCQLKKNTQSLLKKEPRYNYLKNIPVEEYMSYKYKSSNMDIADSVKSWNSKLKASTSTSAQTPSSTNYPDLYNIQSKQFYLIKDYIDEKQLVSSCRKQKESKNVKIIMSPNTLRPVPNAFSKFIDFNKVSCDRMPGFSSQSTDLLQDLIASFTASLSSTAQYSSFITKPFSSSRKPALSSAPAPVPPPTSSALPPVSPPTYSAPPPVPPPTSSAPPPVPPPTSSAPPDSFSEFQVLATDIPVNAASRPSFGYRHSQKTHQFLPIILPTKTLHENR